MKTHCGKLPRWVFASEATDPICNERKAAKNLRRQTLQLL